MLGLLDVNNKSLNSKSHSICKGRLQTPHAHAAGLGLAVWVNYTWTDSGQWPEASASLIVMKLAAEAGLKGRRPPSMSGLHSLCIMQMTRV
jgi:hypothetical protein